MNPLLERERDGMDFCDYVYDIQLRKWVYRPLPMTDREAALADAEQDQRDEDRNRKRQDWLDSEL